MADSQNHPPQFSVVVGRVSTEDGDRVLELIDAIRHQEGSHSYEIVIVDRLGDRLSDRIRKSRENLTWIRCKDNSTLPEMRTIGFQTSRGELVIITEDHCVPYADWFEKFTEAFDQYPEAAAIAGSVDNGVTETGLDWATFLCEYASYYPPIESGASHDLAGMNICYQRTCLERIPEEALLRGFWETTVHPLLISTGQELVNVSGIVIKHCKKFSFGHFSRQRYVYSRYYAGIRFEKKQWHLKVVAAASAVLLPPLLSWRLWRICRANRLLRSHITQALPYLLWFYVVWAIGEFVGYLFGPNSALTEIE